MGQAFYRKYRSKSFDEVVGQEHITATLKNALKSGRISHAYLFTGPKGVGKTSVARILAHAVNDLPYDDDSMHLDIIEIDAASNRRIDEIRDLRERVHTAPASAKYKVYIIDEVHMLTREAFNALLKTLEEPPNHCIFILATTEAHKLPETIVSRTQRFNFKPVGGSKAANHLRYIAGKEKIKVDPDALELITLHGEGSFRDSIGILDQLSSLNNEISAKTARQFLGLPPGEAIVGLADAISAGDSSRALTILMDLRDQGTSAPKIASELSSDLREKLIKGDAGSWIPALLRQLLLVPASQNPYDQLEISILEASSAQIRPAGAKAPVSDQTRDKQVPSDHAESEDLTENRFSGNGESHFDLSLWPEVTAQVKQKAASVYTALRLAQPSLSRRTLTLSFQFPLHQKKVSQAKNLDIVGRVIEEVVGTKLTIKCIVDKNIRPMAVTGKLPEYTAGPESIDDKMPIKAISNIFGAAEVLES